MTFAEKLDRLDSVFAKDQGCANGSVDEAFKTWLRAVINREEVALLLTKLIKEYLAGDGYTFEDAYVLVKWVETELGLEY